MSIHIETVPAKYATVHRVERGEELVEDYEDTVVTEEVALALSYDEVVSIEGTEERVNTLAATMLASVPGGEYLPVRRVDLALLATLIGELHASECPGGLVDELDDILATLTNTR